MDDSANAADITTGDAVAVPSPPVADAPAPVAAVEAEPSAARPSVEAELADHETRIARLEAGFASLEQELTVDHSSATGGLTLGAKVSKLFVTIFGSDSN